MTPKAEGGPRYRVRERSIPGSEVVAFHVEEIATGKEMGRALFREKAVDYMEELEREAAPQSGAPDAPHALSAEEREAITEARKLASLWTDPPTNWIPSSCMEEIRRLLDKVLARTEAK